MSDGVAEEYVDGRDAALPARTLFWRARECFAEEGEAFVSEGFGQHGGVGLDEVERQPVFPGVEIGGGDESGFAGEGCGLPDDEAGLVAEAGGAKVLCPVQAGGFGGKVGLLPGVVGFVDVLVLGEGQMFFGDGMLQIDNALGAGVGVGESRELEHGRDVRLVLGANVAHALGVGEVVLAVGQLQSALQQVGGIVLGVVEAGRDPQSEKIAVWKLVLLSASTSARRLSPSARASSCLSWMAAMASRCGRSGSRPLASMAASFM